MVLQRVLFHAGPLRQLCGGFESSRDDRDADFVAEVFVRTVSPDDFCGGASLVLDVIRDFGNLIHQHFLRAVGDVEQHEVGTGDVTVVEQW